MITNDMWPRKTWRVMHCGDTGLAFNALSSFKAVSRASNYSW